MNNGNFLLLDSFTREINVLDREANVASPDSTWDSYGPSSEGGVEGPDLTWDVKVPNSSGVVRTQKSSGEAI